MITRSKHSPIKLGRLTLLDRVLTAPPTRFYSNPDDNPGEFMREYLCQRKSASKVIVIESGAGQTPCLKP